LRQGGAGIGRVRESGQRGPGAWRGGRVAEAAAQGLVELHGVEALLESILPSSSAAGGDWSKTIPGKLLLGVTGIRPTGANTAGNTPKIGEGSEGPSSTVGQQFFGDVHVNGVHNPDEFNSWSRQQSQSAIGAYPANSR
jgi:hypothetical protein